MSYSFTARGADRSDVIQVAVHKFAEVVSEQPPHRFDYETHRDVLRLQLELLPEQAPTGYEYVASVSGSCQFQDNAMRGCSVSVNIHTAALPAD